MRRKELGYHHKIPYLLGILTVVMYLVPGLPFLLMVFSIFVLIYFWVEKLLILKFYRKPRNLDGTPLEIVDYMVVLILLLHIFSCISTFGTTDIFPEDTKRVQGTRKGFSTSYYEPSEKGFFEKLGVIINIPYVIMLSLILLFLVLCFLCRNKIWWRKFKFFSMSFRYKYKYIPSTFSKAKNLVIIGETSYNMADIERYRQVFATFDLSNINDDTFKSSYSQLFQTSNGPVDTLSKLNLHSSPDKINDSFIEGNLKALSKTSIKSNLAWQWFVQRDFDNMENNRKAEGIRNIGEGFRPMIGGFCIKNWEFDEENKNDQGAEVSGSFGKSENEEEKAVKSMNTMADKILNLKKQFHVNSVFKRSEDD